MKYKKSEKDHFINPYNFVSVNLEETKHFNVEEMNQEGLSQEIPELQTGYLVCHLKCRTPLAIPDTANRKETNIEGHYQYHFMGMKEQTVQGTGAGQKVKTELTGTPEIPGSSIRGVIRNVYETITDSCFGTMKADTSVTIRSNTPFEPGLLMFEDETWRLYAATRHKIVADSKFYEKHRMEDKGIEKFELKQWKDKSGTQVWFQTTVYKREGDNKKECVKFFDKVENSELKTGYLCIGEQNSKRYFHGIFEKKVEYIRVVTEQEIKRLEDTLFIYQNSKINKMYPDKHSGYENYWHMKSKGVIPVYYKISGGEESQNGDEKNSDGILSLSFASLGRKAFEKTLNEKAGQKSHQICSDRNNLCAACSLFGTIEGKGMGSKIRFTDAKRQNPDRGKLIRNVVFEELSYPRISYVPFYLFSDNEHTNYEKGYDSDELQIRGRKFYWHHKPDMSSWKKKTKRNGTFDVLGKDTEFEFKIYFDQITKKQLEILATAVHLNDNKITGKRCHKIGHGKPLGYGSVKMTVDECKIRKYDMQNGWNEESNDELLDKISYSNIFDNDSWENVSAKLTEKDQVQKCDKSTWEDLIKISNFYEIEEDGETKVEYPEIIFNGDKDKIQDKNDLAGHQWYTRNYNLGALYPEQSLSKIFKEDQRLDKYELVDEEQVTDKPKQQKEKNKENSEEVKNYQARIMSCGVPGNNSNYLIYEIEILDDDYFTVKKCRLSAYKGIKLKENQLVDTVLYKGNIFNLKKEEK